MFGMPDPVPYILETDLLDVAADLGAGVHTAADVYRMHETILAQAKRLPISKRSFGLALAEAGWVSSTKVIDDVRTRCWMITKPWERRGLKHVNG